MGGGGMVAKPAKKKPVKKKAVKKPTKKAGKKPAIGKNGKPKKKKKAKDPNKPKRAMVAFMYFSIDQRPVMQRQNPTLKIADISKMLGAQWRSMSAAQKKNPSLGIADISKELGKQWRGMNASQKVPYEEKAAKDKMRYEKEMKSFKK